MVNLKFHLIQSYCELFFYHFPNIPCLKYTVNSNFNLIRSKTLPMNDFELTVPDLYQQKVERVKFKKMPMYAFYFISQLFPGFLMILVDFWFVFYLFQFNTTYVYF